MPAPRSHRRAARPVYPGTLPALTLGMIGFALSLMGFKLPWHASLWQLVALEAGVVWLLWRGVRLFLATLKSPLRLFNAQAMLAYAVLLQAFILLLRH